jgi:phosphorylated CTD-interacting factor 1
MFAYGDDEEDDILSKMAAEQYGVSDEEEEQAVVNNNDNRNNNNRKIVKHYVGDQEIWNSQTSVPTNWLNNPSILNKLIPCNIVAHELLRKKTLQLIRNHFNKVLEETTFESNTDKLNQAFEKWYFTAKSNETVSIDPLLTSKIDELTEKALTKSLEETGMAPATATTISHQVSKFTLQTNSQYIRQMNHFGFNNNNHNNMLSSNSMVDNINTKHVSLKRGVNMGNDVIDTSMMLLKYRKSKQRITVQHYEKLKTLINLRIERFNETFKNDVRQEKIQLSDNDINDRIFCLLLRYNAINGTYTEGAGFQAAIPGACFDVLLRHLDCSMECFASPLNCRYPTFCSAFLDTDVMFGSIGSFFSSNFNPIEGSYEANPPFVDTLIQKMALKMDMLLSTSKKQKKSLSFVVIIPEWDQTSGWKTLANSKYLRNHIVIQQRDHGYTEGAQHLLNKTRFRIATFNTSIFILQNKRGKKKWPVTNEFIEELKNSFISKHNNDRKKRGRDGSAGNNIDDEELALRKKNKT